LKYKELWKG